MPADPTKAKVASQWPYTSPLIACRFEPQGKFVFTSAEDNTIHLALIGCGGRGSGAAANALTVPNGNAKLVAMADIFQPRIDAAARSLAREFGAAVDVPKERQFLGFDAYRKAIDCLRPGDVALLTTQKHNKSSSEYWSY